MVDLSFSTWLKQRRKEFDLTQADLAEQAGCSLDMVRKIERGIARPSRQLAELIIAAVGIPAAERPAFVQWARTGLRPGQAPYYPGEEEPRGEPASAAALGEQARSITAENSSQEQLNNPYKGLRPFGESDAEDFFGREELTRRLISTLRDDPESPRFLLVVGPSGSGKSSVVRAGLLPALRRGALPGSTQWVVVDVTPGAHPFEEVEAALLKVAVNPPASLLPQILEDERGLLRAAKRVLPPTADTALLLVIDQFEELFTLVEDESNRQFFLESISTLITDPRSPARVIGTLRADFYGHPLLYPRFGELVRRGTEVILPMSGDELERAIVLPAERAGVRLEAGLLAAIVQDVTQQPGALPLLQYALTELFERRDGTWLTLRAYEEIGGVSGSLSRRAEAIYGQLTGTEQQTMQQLFLRLVMPGEGVEDTRRRVRIAELLTATPDEAALHKVLDLLGRYRLLTFDRDPITAVPTVEVAHEALLSTWARLHNWLDEFREDLRIHRRLLAATTEWLGANRDPSFLAVGTKLAQFEALATRQGIALNTEEQSYISSSIAERSQQQQTEERRRANEQALRKRAARGGRYLVITLSTFLVIATALALFALNQQQQAEVSAVQSGALRLADEANSLLQTGGQGDLPALLAIRSLQQRYTTEGDEAMELAYVLKHPEQWYSGEGGSVFTAAYSPDGTYILLGRAEKTAQLWDVSLRQRIRSFDSHGDAVVSAVFSRDGRFVLTGSLDRSARIWDSTSSQLLYTLPDHGYQVWDVAFSPDGRQVLTSGGKNNTARLWDATSGKELEQLAGHTRVVNSVAFSPDGKLALTGSADNTARIWDLSTARTLFTLKGHEGQVWGVAFSPDGKLALTGSADETARLWDTGTGQELRQLKGHQGAVGRVAFSPDGKYVATASWDHTARLWDVTSGEELRVFVGNAGVVGSVAFAPDGNTLLVADTSKGARLWPLDFHQTLNMLCADVTRDLTSEERARYLISGNEPTCPSK